MNNFYNNTGIPNNGNFTQPVYNNQPNQYYPPQRFQQGNTNYSGSQFNGGYNNQFNYNQPINYVVNPVQPNITLDPVKLEKDRKKEEEKRSIKSSSNKVAGGMLIFAGISLIIVTILSIPVAFTNAYSLDNSGYIQGVEPLTMYIMNAINSLFGMGITGIIITKLCKFRLDDVLTVNKVNISDIIKYTFASMGFIFIFNLLLTLMNLNLGLFGFENNMPDYGEINGVVPNIIYYFTIAIVPPVTEEFLFRGAILGSLRKHGDAFAIIISALMFGFAHANFLQTPVTFLTGLVLGYVTVKSNSIIPALIIHFVNNSLAFLPEALEKVITNKDIIWIINSGIGFVFLMVGLICTVLLIKKYNNSLFTLEKSESQLSMSQKIRTCLLTPCMIIFTIYTLTMCVYAVLMP